MVPVAMSVSPARSAARLGANDRPSARPECPSERTACTHVPWTPQGCEVTLVAFTSCCWILFPNGLIECINSIFTYLYLVFGKR